MSRTTSAIVTSAPIENALQWKLEMITIQGLGEDELLIDVVASGLCATDITASLMPEGYSGYPKVVGHEGAGYVKEIGSKVTVAKVGDPVVLSFASCKSCRLCSTGHPAYCDQFFQSNFPIHSGTYKASDGSSVGGGFFGQSSFSKTAVAKEVSVVNLSGLVNTVEELTLFAPLGCGLQTGASSVLKRAAVTADDSVAVVGLGGVGMAALMTAKILGCKNIVGIDIIASRLKVATELGATAVIDSSDQALDLAAEVKKVTNGVGPSVTIDTTGNLAVITTAFGFTAPLGRLVVVGVSRPATELPVNLSNLMRSGKVILSSVEGDAIPSELIPEMIKWYREGKFPLEKLVEYFKAADFEAALAAMKDGSAIKPVLVW